MTYQKPPGALKFFVWTCLGFACVMVMAVIVVAAWELAVRLLN